MAKKKRAAPSGAALKKSASVTRPNNSTNKLVPANFIVRFYLNMDGIRAYVDGELSCGKAPIAVLGLLKTCFPKYIEEIGEPGVNILAARLQRAFNLMTIGLVVEVVIPCRNGEKGISGLGFHRQPVASDRFTESVLTMHMAYSHIAEKQSKPTEQDMGRYALVFNTGEGSHE